MSSLSRAFWINSGEESHKYSAEATYETSAGTPSETRVLAFGCAAAIAQGNPLLSPKAQSGSSADWGRKVQFHQNQDFLQPFDVSDPLLTLKPKPSLKEYTGDHSNFR